MLLWLSDRSQTAANFVKDYLLTHSAAANDVNGDAITVSASGLKKVYAGAQAANFVGVPVPVETTEIAPTILSLLGLNPSAVDAVRIEHTPVLPGLR